MEGEHVLSRYVARWQRVWVLIPLEEVKGSAHGEGAA